MDALVCRMDKRVSLGSRLDEGGQGAQRLQAPTKWEGNEWEARVNVNKTWDVWAVMERRRGPALTTRGLGQTWEPSGSNNLVISERKCWWGWL